MKKALKAVLFVLFGVIPLVLCAGCSVFGYRPDANYPYNIAVENGYTGTEAEWLTEQEVPETVYRRMYAEAVSDGSFTGTYFEFLQELGPVADATPYIQRALLSVVSVMARFPSGNSTITSSGAGVIYRMDKGAGDAYIITNYHVLYTAKVQQISTDIVVCLYGNKTASGEIAATYYGGSMDYDLAILRVRGSEILKASDACAATLGAADVVAGEPVYAVGNPLNRDISVTGGIVSVEEEWVTLKAANETDYILLPEIRIDAAVNHGNSGGGLFNASGELVGVVNARNSSEDVSGFGYAIPLKLAAAFAENAIGNGGAPVSLHDGLTIAVEGSKAVYDEAAGRTHISQKLCVDEFGPGAGSVIGIAKGDTLISGYVLRGGEKRGETQFTRPCAFEAFRFLVQPGDTLCLVVSRAGEQKLLQGAVPQIYFDRL